MKIRKWLMVIGSLLCSLLLLIWGVQYFFHEYGEYNTSFMIIYLPMR